MSLDSDLAATIEAANNLTEVVDNKVQEIDSKVSEAEKYCLAASAALPDSLSVKIYIDPINGVDSNSGSVGAPIKTLKYAVETLAPVSGSATIYILSSIDITEDIYVNKNQQLFISSGQSEKVDIHLKLFEHNPESSPNEFKMTTVAHIGWAGNVSVLFNNVRIHFPSLDDLPAGGFISTSYTNSIFAKKASYQTHIFAGFYKIEFVVPVNPLQYFYVIGDTWGCQSLAVNSAIFDSAAMQGHWIYGVNALTAPKDTGRVLSNLATL